MLLNSPSEAKTIKSPSSTLTDEVTAADGLEIHQTVNNYARQSSCFFVLFWGGGRVEGELKEGFGFGKVREAERTEEQASWEGEGEALGWVGKRLNHGTMVVRGEGS